jgi:AcrR family transcriptional regulator
MAVIRLPVAERRARLVDAALSIAEADGIGAVTVRRVADRAGVALGVVHYCFADKDELLAALAERIVDDLTGAGSAALEFDEPPSLQDALGVAVAGLWERIEATRDAQLLTYEITTHALRTAELRGAADRQYSVSQAAAELLLTEAAQAAGATWRRPIEGLAAEALAIVDGVTLRWLVDGDGAGARERLAAFVGYLSGQADR